MKTKLLNIQNELEITYGAYEGLQILLGNSSTDSELICPLLIVINEKLKRCMDNLNKARKETSNKEGNKLKLEIVPNQPQ